MNEDASGRRKRGRGESTFESSIAHALIDDAHRAYGAEVTESHADRRDSYDDEPSSRDGSAASDMPF